MSVNEVALAPTVATSLKPVSAFRLRSIRNAVSFAELSFQCNVMLVGEFTVKARPDGGCGAGTGAASVVTVATFENAESPAALYARTR